MALAGIILRRSASTIAPLAARFVGRQRIHHLSAASSLIRRHGSFSTQRTNTACCAALGTGLCSHRRHFSAASDKKLVLVIDSEIDCAIEGNETEEAVIVPEGFPFRIVDNPGQNVIELHREYDGETISVEVNMPNLVSGEDDDDDGSGGAYSNIPLSIRVSKKNGAVLEFTCTAFADEITIDALSMKNPDITDEDIAYEGPDFGDLDENLQKAFHKYLEIRGIKPSTTNFLHEYMVNKDSKEYLKWLNDLKQFVTA